ncbi:Histone deacetylase-like amidohydrolase [Gimesia panareensis]|uniref:Histone deacetylase-like amidohydrolase n=1 Tax=Gimesia panareensis TaxID=2527978 RepID=A0A517QA64_9PLAN|nr:histone deacetylase [Gimesia panareensis]QDT28517.1 Histone deacetylase-like amidohydrolase [Gimesia panareensis]
MTVFYQSKTFLQHETGAHPENPQRLRAVMDEVAAEQIASLTVENDPAVKNGQEIERVHTAAYLKSVAYFCAEGGGRIETDTVVCPRSFEVARYAAGCAVKAVDQVVQGKVKRVFCAVRPPGHHALSNQAMGFCLINNIAVAARHAIVHHQLNRVLIVDWDVHHGNGTQDIFYEEDQVYFFSAHRHPFYPGTGMGEETGVGKGLGTIWNLPLAFGISREKYFQEFERMLLQAAEKCKPELVLISAGFDAHKDDPIGSLGLETEDFGRLTRLVAGVADQYCQGRIISLLEGGYNPQKLAESVVCHLKELGTAA